ncbi:CRTAC1 family protein [Longirhabdus pacifica]|uniref:CRTAC1 family protein n=1 Tax=Longirhabdus pacifica TaxID=2305227 RepID=UPI001008F5FF|nr:CRTAC1 family protein [Longirhabdus pacifica]
MSVQSWVKCSIILCFVLVVSACSPSQGEGRDYGFSFEDQTEKANLTFLHEKPTYDSKVDNIMPWLATTGAGVYIEDYDQDGFVDLYFTNTKRGTFNALYRNNGDGTFHEVGEALGVVDVNQTGVSQTALWFDYNNDTFPDLFVGTWSGACKLFENNQDGTFTDVTTASGIDTVVGNFSKAMSLDYNRDGNLDLYIGAYFHEEHDMFNLTTTKIMHNDFEKAENGGKNLLLQNNNGVFTDVAEELGVADRGWTLATGSADLNHDGWPDIYNANDFGPDTLYINEEGKRFVEVEQSRGIGEDTFKGMNIDFADVFHNGDLAMYVSNVSKPLYILEGNQLWHIDEEGRYIDRAPEMGVHLADFSWGAHFFDVDNSGEYSLSVATGFLSASKKHDYWFDLGTLATTPGKIVEDAKNWIPFQDKSLSGYEKSFLFWNDGSSFTNIAEEVGITFDSDSRGVAELDVLNNGMLDLIFANQAATPNLYINKNETGNHWIKLDLIGTYPSNADAVGAKVTLEVNGVTTVIQRDGASSHGAQSDPRIHFGLGSHTQVDQLTIEWPSGRVQTMQDVAGDQMMTIIEPDTAQ